MGPANTTKYPKTLGLYDERNVKLLSYSIGSERNCTYGPKKHHRLWKPHSALCPVVSPYLRYELYTPEHSPECAKHICCQWYGCLRRHSGSVALSKWATLLYRAGAQFTKLTQLVRLFNKDSIRESQERNLQLKISGFWTASFTPIYTGA